MISKEDLNILIEEIKNNNMDVFDEFYDLTKSSIYYTIISILKDKSLAEDVMQDTYLKVLSSISSYKANTNALAWMIMIARNLALNVYNKRKREVLIDDLNTFEEIPAIEKNDDSSLLNQMYKVLRPKEIELIIMHVINQLSHKEIAQILNRPLGTVLWQYNQAIKKLRKKVGESDES